ncbi:GNAT family N-acetyltransferase [Streptomyces sp. NBC_01218]|uniref:GNAT family N-acetyltransferase n=1 Tax=unclassified Streptomyces TaxID=2593676 RepID=UPI002E11D4AE|nr:GNAT family N-acetyltransferase [Streptomyces sp. NBC_01218]
MEKTPRTPAPEVRRATAADVPALVRLRALMLADMGIPAGPEDAPWREAAGRWFTERLAGEADFAAFVVEEPGRGVVSCAVGTCDHHAPGPTSPSGLRGHVSNVATEHAARHQGYARACTEALLRWFAEETEVSAVDLHATADGTHLYETLGFRAPRFPALQIRLGTP